jgi:hypothetical protein
MNTLGLNPFNGDCFLQAEYSKLIEMSGLHSFIHLLISSSVLMPVEIISVLNLFLTYLHKSKSVTI